MAIQKATGLTDEELDEIVPQILAGDQEKFAIFYEAYKGCVHDITKKWVHKINKASCGLYEFQDLANELWIRVWQILPKYDSKKAKMSTYIYLTCQQNADRIWRWHSAALRSPGERYGVLSLDFEINDDQDLALHQVLADPFNVIDNFESESELFFQLYTLQLFISKLTHREQIIYYHQMKKMTMRESGDVLALTHERIRQIRDAILKKQHHFFLKYEQATFKESSEFSTSLLSRKSDEEICDEMGYDLAVVKICREVLQAADLYVTSPGKECIA